MSKMKKPKFPIYICHFCCLATLTALKTEHKGLLLIESQNRWGWKEPLEIVQSNPLLKASAGCPELCPVRFFNTSKDGDSTTSLGNLLQCSTIPTVKKFGLTFKWHLLYFSLCPWPLVLSRDTTEKSLALSPLLLPISWQTLVDTPKLSLPQAELSFFSHPRLVWQMHLPSNHLNDPWKSFPGEANWPIFLCFLLLALLKGRNVICFLLVLRNLPQSHRSFKGNWEWSHNSSSQLPQYSWVHSTRACRFVYIQFV